MANSYRQSRCWKSSLLGLCFNREQASRMTKDRRSNDGKSAISKVWPIWYWAEPVSHARKVLGTTSLGTFPGDIVYIIMLLHPIYPAKNCSDGRWSPTYVLVGESYIHGLMHEERIIWKRVSLGKIVFPFSLWCRTTFANSFASKVYNLFISFRFTSTTIAIVLVEGGERQGKQRTSYWNLLLDWISSMLTERTRV